MDKRILCLIFVLIFFSFVSLEITGKSVTGETITGEATSKQISMSINVVLPDFYLDLISPKNKTYITNLSLPLQYSAVGEELVWYNLDFGTNFSINDSFNASEGSHTFNLFANNSIGTLLNDSVNFKINISKLRLDYDSWYDSSESSCTDFNKTAFEDLQDLSSVFFENNYGKIEFSESINISDGLNSSDNFVSLDENIVISSNFVFVNSSALPNFNKASNIQIKGLNFTNPRILRNGEVCDSSICQKINYENGTLVFSVSSFSSFSNYSVQETPSGEDGDEDSVGGGGTGVAGEGSLRYILEDKIVLEKDYIRVFLKKGQTFSDFLKIKNKHDFNLSFSAEIDGVKSLIKLEEDSFEIGTGQEYELRIDFLCSEDVSPNIYFGKLIIKTGSVEKEIKLIVEVESKSALFDVEIVLPNQFQEVYPGEEIPFITKLVNLGEIKKADVNLNYFIKDFNGKNFIFESDSFAVETQASHSKTLTIPEDIPPGDYLIYVRLDYNGATASASHQFKVKSVFSLELAILEIVLIVLIIIVMIILIILFYKGKKNLKKQKVLDKVIDET